MILRVLVSYTKIFVSIKTLKKCLMDPGSIKHTVSVNMEAINNCYTLFESTSLS